MIVILMPGIIGYRRLLIENLIERGLGSGDPLGERFHPMKLHRMALLLKR